MADCHCVRCTTEREAAQPGEKMFGVPVALMRFFICETCGNKRCPHSDDHRNACTGSNEPGQPGSRYEHATFPAESGAVDQLACEASNAARSALEDHKYSISPSPLPEGLDLAELKRVAEAATHKSEWVAVEAAGGSAVTALIPTPDLNGCLIRQWTTLTPRDRDFIATFDPPTVLSLLHRLETSVEAAKEARHRAEVAEAAAALMAEQRDRLQAQLARAREGLSGVWTIKHVYEAQLDDADAELGDEDAALVSGIFAFIREVFTSLSEKGEEGSSGGRVQAGLRPTDEPRSAGPFSFEAQMAERFSDPEWLAKWNAAADERRPFVELLHALRAEEGDSVTLLCDNPDGPPNNAVECCGLWTDWQERRFSGESLHAAVLAAYRARRATESSEVPPISPSEASACTLPPDEPNPSPPPTINQEG